MRIIASLLLSCSTFALLPWPAFAGPVTIPGLPPGDFYRLAFVTSTTRDGTSSNIADYNTFVTSAANSVPALTALSAQWSAIAGTPTVAAENNTITNPSSSQGFPIYNLAGALVAFDNSSLWGGSLINPINFDEHGNVANLTVWGGTNSDGTLFSSAALGSGNAPHVSIGGLSSLTNSSWIAQGTSPQATLFSLYAISSILEVPFPTPEPNSLTLACLAVTGLAVTALRRRRR